MESFLPLLGSILKDHGEAINAIMILITAAIGYLYYTAIKAAKSEREQLLTMFKKHVETDRAELIEVIERYQEGQINIVQALNEIRLLIATIGTKL
jgi:hypothetical protein